MHALAAGGVDPQAGERLELTARFVGVAFTVWEEGVDAGARDPATLDAYAAHVTRLVAAMIDPAPDP